MSDQNKEFDRVLKEVTREITRLNSQGSGPPLPYYVDYDGLRVVENAEKPAGTPASRGHENEDT